MALTATEHKALAQSVASRLSALSEKVTNLPKVDDPSKATATSADIRLGMKAIGSDGKMMIGTMTSSGVVIDGQPYTGGNLTLASEYAWFETTPPDSEALYRYPLSVFEDSFHTFGSNDPTKHQRWNGQAWEDISVLPIDMIGSKSVVFNGAIHILSSLSGLDMKAHYAWNGLHWERVSTMPFGLFDGDVKVLDNEIHCISQNTHYKWNGSVWQYVSTTPLPVPEARFETYNGRLHLIGSAEAGHYAFNGEEWVLTSSAPYSCHNPNLAVIDGKLHLFGSGIDDDNINRHYSFNGITWEEESLLPFGFMDSYTLQYNGITLIIGEGKTEKRSFYYTKCYRKVE